jgi:hypothetical protein
MNYYLHRQPAQAFIVVAMHTNEVRQPQDTLSALSTECRTLQGISKGRYTT